ncbi:MAG: divergent polysaccharide deacetylase family protein [Gammaproteobacteria bacterium]|nr:divergent polysaccharide deacetylase family protein [Gammaproteobacteria bacterium]
MMDNAPQPSCLPRRNGWPQRLCLWLSLAATAGLAQAETTPDNQPPTGLPPISIGIIIDDLGYLNQRDARAVHLPGAVTLAFLPQTPHAHELATLAHRLKKEIMLHLPMESMHNQRLGPGGLTLDMTARQFTKQLQLDLDSVPHVVGVNNHMGSLLTQHPGHMQWLMLELRKRNNLYFVDSYTTKTSIAQQLANENWIPNLRRDVFLDHDRNPEMIRFHFRRLINKARQNGSALAIGHPFPETMKVLEEELPKLRAQGIRLLPVSQLVQQTMEDSKLWQAYLSH